MTEKAPEISKTRKLGGQLSAVGATLIALSIVLPMLGVLGGTLMNVMLALGVGLGVVGMGMSRIGKK